MNDTSNTLGVVSNDGTAQPDVCQSCMDSDTYVSLPQKVQIIPGVWCASTGNLLHSVRWKFEDGTEATTGVILDLNVHKHIIRGEGVKDIAPWGYIHDINYIARMGSALDETTIMEGSTTLQGYETTPLQLGVRSATFIFSNSNTNDDNDGDNTNHNQHPGSTGHATSTLMTPCSIPLDMPIHIATKAVGTRSDDVLINKFYQLHHNILVINRHPHSLLSTLKRHARIQHASIMYDLRKVKSPSQDALGICAVLGLSASSAVAPMEDNVQHSERSTQQSTPETSSSLPTLSANADDTTTTTTTISDHRIRLWTETDIHHLPASYDIDFDTLATWCATSAVVRVRKLEIRRGDGQVQDVTEGRARQGLLFAMLDPQIQSIAVAENIYTHMVDCLKRNDRRNLTWSSADIWSHPSLTTTHTSTIRMFNSHAHPPTIIVGLETVDQRVMEIEIGRDMWFRQLPKVIITQQCPGLTTDIRTTCIEEANVLLTSLPMPLGNSCMVLGSPFMFGRATLIDYDVNAMQVYTP